MGVMPDKMLMLTPGEILRYYRGYQLRQTREWERARFLAWYGAIPYDTKKSLPTPYSVMQLSTDPTDEEITAMRQGDDEEALAIIRKFKAEGRI